MTSGPLEPLAVRLELDLPRGCGTMANFAERLHSRLERVRVVDQGASRVVEARIASTADGGYRATMTLIYPDGHSAARMVGSNNCSDALDALAFITAVTLDPLGVLPEPPAATNLNATSAPVSPTTKPPLAAMNSSEKAPIVAGTVSSKTVPPSPAPQRKTVLGLGLSFATFRGPSPGWLHGVEFSARFMRPGAAAFSPSVRLGTSYALRRGIVAVGGTADFGLASVLVEFCPSQWLWSVAELRGCGLAHLGAVIADGRSTVEPETHRRPYLALGATAELVLALSNQLVAPFRFFATRPTSRDTYAFDPTAFYQVSPVAFGFTAGLETRFR